MVGYFWNFFQVNGTYSEVEESKVKALLAQERWGYWKGMELELGYRGQEGALTEPMAGAGGLRVI